MLEFKETFNLLAFDQIRFHKTFDRTMSQILRESAREWLRSILKNGVPVETGMAKAAIEPLGRYLNKVSNLKITPTRAPYYTKLEGGVQSPEFGRQKSSFRLVDDKSNPLTFIYTFEWETNVLHWWLAEHYSGSPAGEELLQEAEEAFFDYMSDAIARRLPQYADFLRFEL